MNITDRPTPETDAATDFTAPEKLRAVARRLEQQRDALREALVKRNAEQAYTPEYVRAILAATKGDE